MEVEVALKPEVWAELFLRGYITRREGGKIEVTEKFVDALKAKAAAENHREG